MNYVETERKLLQIKTNDPVQVSGIKIQLLNRKRKLDYFLEKLIETEPLDLSKNTKDVRFYNSRCEEYITINKLLRIIDAYC